MERRKLTKEDIDKVRNIEGFPIGSDEDIIALSSRSMALLMMRQRTIIIGSRLQQM